jgi:hypothetical protein
MLHRFRFSLLLALLLSVLLPYAAAPHRGGLDSYGCHHDQKQGGYHCHRGRFAGQSFASRHQMRGEIMRDAKAQTEQQEGASDLTLQPSPPGRERACIREDKSKQVVCGEVVEQVE